MVEAEPGEAADISDPQTGSSVRVVAGRRYYAASGKTCRRFRVLSPGRYEGLSEGLACRAPSGDWTVSALILNPSDLGTRP